MTVKAIDRILKAFLCSVLMSFASFHWGGVNTACAQQLPRQEAHQWCMLSSEDMQGTLRIPVVFLSFTDAASDNEKAISATNQNNWMVRLNDKCTNNHMGEEGSVSDYFRAQSYGLTDVVFEQVGTYTAAGSAAAYQDQSTNPQLAKNIARALKGSVDWSRYDNNGDGEVDCLLIIYAGHCDGDESSRGTVIKSIYPHRGWFEAANISKEKTDDGSYIQGYVFMNSQRHHSTSLNNIGTACHELSHGIFGLNDYYKNLVSYMGQYDAMCYGYRQMTYGAANDHCCDLCSFNRMLLGWLTPAVLTTPCHVTLQPLSREPDACVIFDPKDSNHFFMLENRAQLEDTWDAHLPAGGLVVTEIHWNRQTFQSHYVNAYNTRNVQLICAATSSKVAYPNASYFNADQTQIPYGIEGRQSISSRVSSVFSTQTVTNIRANRDGTVEFDFMGGGTPVGIDDLPKAEPLSQPAFDLWGRQVDGRGKGIVIENGKKILRSGN